LVVVLVKAVGQAAQLGLHKSVTLLPQQAEQVQAVDLAAKVAAELQELAALTQVLQVAQQAQDLHPVSLAAASHTAWAVQVAVQEPPQLMGPTELQIAVMAGKVEDQTLQILPRAETADLGLLS
jgi:hypothetical protein